MHGKSDFLHGILLFHHGKSDFLHGISLFPRGKSDFLHSISLFPRSKSDFLRSISPFPRSKSDFLHTFPLSTAGKAISCAGASNSFALSALLIVGNFRNGPKLSSEIENFTVGCRSCPQAMFNLPTRHF